jgi:molybdate transport system regulatory protein
MTRGTIALQGAVWITVGGDSLGGHGRIGLLRAIAATGSITQAAKSIGMSYKAAWDAVDTMNNLAGAALVERSAGGRGGGSTRLTSHGEHLVQRFELINSLHRRFVGLLSENGADLAQDLDLLKIINMKTSARNQFSGSVTAIRRGAVNDEIELRLPGGQAVVAIITRESTESLALQIGTTAFALVEASSVLLMAGGDGALLSARNQLTGTVCRVQPGVVNAEVVVTLSGGGTIAAMLTQHSVQRLGFTPGMPVTALFKASSVIVGVPA